MPKADRQHAVPALHPRSDAIAFATFRLDLRASERFAAA
jgi:hypothetical protein